MDKGESSSTKRRTKRVNPRLLYVLYTKIYEQANKIFPFMEFKKTPLSGWWVSPYYIDGTKTENIILEASFITPRRPSVIQDYNGKAVNVIEFYAQQTGQSYNKAVCVLCDVCKVYWLPIFVERKRRKTPTTENEHEETPQ